MGLTVYTLRSRLAAVALLVVLGQIVPASAWYLVLSPHHTADPMECTCVGDSHGLMCPMHRSPNAMGGDAGCHLDAASVALPAGFHMAAVLSQPFTTEPRSTTTPVTASTESLHARTLPVDLAPPRA